MKLKETETPSKELILNFCPTEWGCDICGKNEFELILKEDNEVRIRCANRDCRGHFWSPLDHEQKKEIEIWIKELYNLKKNQNSSSKSHHQPTTEKDQTLNTPTTTDFKNVFSSLTQSLGHGAQVGGAVEARQLILDIFYSSIGGKEKMPVWLTLVPERVLAVFFSVVLFVLANVIWTEMPFGKQVAYACRLCWEADGRDIVQPYAARLRLAIEKVGPSLPTLPEPKDTSSAN